MSSKTSVSSYSNVVCIVRIAALLPDICPAHSWSEPLALTTSFLGTLITLFPQILLKTAPLPLSSGIGLLATRCCMVVGSMYCVHTIVSLWLLPHTALNCQ